MNSCASWSGYWLIVPEAKERAFLPTAWWRVKITVDFAPPPCPMYRASTPIHMPYYFVNPHKEVSARRGQFYGIILLKAAAYRDRNRLGTWGKTKRRKL